MTLQRAVRRGLVVGLVASLGFSITADTANAAVGRAPTWVVNSSSDTGDGECDPTECTLREALQAAVDNGLGRDVVRFDVPGPVPITIRPTSPLPTVRTAILIDGTTQPGYSGAPVVEIDGSLAGPTAVGLALADETCPGGSGLCDDQIVRALTINRFASFGVARYSGFSEFVLEDSYIGTDSTGAGAAGNGADGVLISNVDNTQAVQIRRNVISGNAGWGILDISSSTTTIAGNRIGTNATGSAAIGNDGGGVYAPAGGGHFIGGDSRSDANVVSGNNGPGISASRVDLVWGNRIGTDKSGTRALGNAGPGLILRLQTFSGPGVIGGSEPGQGNVIAANGGVGVNLVDIDGLSTNAPVVVAGNSVGTDPTGAIDLGNGGAGIALKAVDNIQIGGLGFENTVAFNDGPAVSLSSAFGDQSNHVRLAQNSVYGNSGLTFDLADDGPTLNDPGDADRGPNHLQNFPVLTATMTHPAGTRVVGYLQSSPAEEFTVDIYAAPACGTDARGESAEWLGAIDVVTDSTGRARFREAFAETVPPGWYLAASASGGLETSEFSPCLAVSEG